MHAYTLTHNPGPFTTRSKYEPQSRGTSSTCYCHTHNTHICDYTQPSTIYHEIKKYESQRGGNKSTYWVIFELTWRDYFK